MSQNYTKTDPATGVTAFGSLYAILRNHADAACTLFSGTAFPTVTTADAGRPCYRTDRLTANGVPKLYVYTGLPSLGESGWVEFSATSVLGEELVNSRGTKSTLDERLDVALNEDGTLKASTTLNPSQWYLPSLTFTYASSTSFTVNGDQTDIYKATRRLKINLAASTVYSEVVSASYSSPNTTVQILDAVLTNPITSVEHSLQLPDWDGKSAISPRMSGNRKVKTVSGNYTTTLNDETILVDSSGGAITITVLAAATLGAGRRQKVIKIDSSVNAVTIDPNSSETINGNAAYAITVPLTGIEYESDGTNLRTIDDAVNKVEASDILSDYVVSGLLGTDPGASLSMTIPAGVACVLGRRVVKLTGASDLTRTYTASRDTYVDISHSGAITYTEVTRNDYVVYGFYYNGLNAGSLTQYWDTGSCWINGIYVVNPGGSYAYTASKDTYDSIDVNGTVTHTEVANGAGQPSLPANSVWFQKMVTNASQATLRTDLRTLTSNAPSVASNSIRLMRVCTNATEIIGVSDLRTPRLITPKSKYRGALVGKSATQSLTAGSFDYATWDVEIRDTDGIHDNSTNNTRLTVPAGVSKIRLSFNGRMSHTGTPNGEAAAYLCKNKSTSIYSISGNAIGMSVHGSIYPSIYVGEGFAPMLVSPVLDVIPGDYFEIKVIPAGNTTTPNLSLVSWFEMEIIE